MIPEVLRYDECKAAQTIIDFSSDCLREAHCSRLVIGASTGLDSTTAAYVGKEIVGSENLILLHLPHHNYEKAREEFTHICDLVSVPEKNRVFIDIMPLLQAYPEPGSTLQMTNLLTRIQRAILFDYSHKNDAPLFGTLNRTEYELGEFPIFALEASIQPIRGLFKTQVRALAAYLGAPQYIQDRIPTIDSWMGKDYEINRTKLVKIGIPIVDQILKYSLDHHCSSEQIITQGFLIEDVDFVLRMQKKNAFKKQLPYVPSL